MFKVKGKYGSAKIFTDVVEQSAISQVINLCNQACSEGSRIRLMPDIHAGKGCTIGTTMTIGDRAVPSLVGADIGCGVSVVKLKERRVELPKLDSMIRKNIPSGGSIRDHALSDIDLSNLRCFKKRNCKVNEDAVGRSLGTLGGGNHFIEVDKGTDGSLYLVIHSGSKRLGKDVAEWYQDRAYEELGGRGSSAVPYEFAYCEGELLSDYLHDIDIVQKYASLNRKTMIDIILKAMKLHSVEEFETIHNYIDVNSMILRKGAVSASRGEILLIPINMRDGSLLCRGKGNPDWNYSAPHGAGRLMSRSDAKNSFTVNEYKKQMSGIFTTSVGKGTLDECPMAYKNTEDIVKNIGNTVDILEVLKPIYNFKASIEVC